MKEIFYYSTKKNVLIVTENHGNFYSFFMSKNEEHSNWTGYVRKDKNKKRH